MSKNQILDLIECAIATHDQKFTIYGYASAIGMAIALFIDHAILYMVLKHE